MRFQDIFKTDREFMNAWRRLIRDYSVEMVEDALKEIGGEEIENMFSSIGRVRGEVVVKTERGVDYVVINMKHRGFPDVEEIVEELIAKYPELKGLRGNIEFERFFQNLWWNEVELFYNELNDEFRNTLGEVSEIGRSGGWWGFSLDTFDFEFRKDCIEELGRKVMERLKGADDLEEEIVIIYSDGSVELDYANLFYYKYIKESDLARCLDIKKEQKSAFMKFVNILKQEAKQWEQPDRWVELLEDNFLDELREMAGTVRESRIRKFRFLKRG